MNQEMVSTIAGLLGGLAVFIYGMNLMSEGLQKAAGEKMKKILSVLTKNPLVGMLAGALVPQCCRAARRPPLWSSALSVQD